MTPETVSRPAFPPIRPNFGEAVMIQFNHRSPEQSSRFNRTVASLLMTATVILSGFLSLAVFAG
jgi:hypothetical protein